MERDILDAPSEDDIYEDLVHDKLQALIGTDIINGIKVSAIFDEKIDGNDYYTYIIGGKSMTFFEAFKMLINY